MGDVAFSTPHPGVEEFVRSDYFSMPGSLPIPQLPNSAALLAMDAAGDIYGDFNDYGVLGVWEFDPFQGWHQLSEAGVTLLASA